MSSRWWRSHLLWSRAVGLRRKLCRSRAASRAASALLSFTWLMWRPRRHRVRAAAEAVTVVGVVTGTRTGLRPLGHRSNEVFGSSAPPTVVVSEPHRARRVDAASNSARAIVGWRGRAVGSWPDKARPSLCLPVPGPSLVRLVREHPREEARAGRRRASSDSVGCSSAIRRRVCSARRRTRKIMVTTARGRPVSTLGRAHRRVRPRRARRTAR